jgi:hypothetical protein
VIDITGTALGLLANEVNVTYTGGSDGLARRSHTAANCTVVIPGTSLRCVSVPGAGANYTFTVEVAGGVSNSSADTVSFAAPIILALEGPGATGASTAGGASITLTGSNFGPTDGNISVSAWASPTAHGGLVFPGHNCTVVKDHVAIQCEVAAGAGTALSWRVVVEGLANAVPLASYAPPSLVAVNFTDVGIIHASTTGGTRLSLLGHNLWHEVAYVEVAVTTPAGTARASACAYAVNHTTLVCVLPAGVGAISLVSVTVLGQTATLAPHGLAYEPPAAVSVSPSTWPTNVASLPGLVTVMGSGFGSLNSSGLVSVRATPLNVSGLCDSGQGSGVLFGTAISVLDDSALTFSIPASFTHRLAAGWQVYVVVAGQPSSASAVTVNTSSPGITEINVGSLNGTHSFLEVFGSSFGAGSCAGDVTMTVGGAFCDELKVAEVGAKCTRCTSPAVLRLWLWVRGGGVHCFDLLAYRVCGQ